MLLMYYLIVRYMMFFEKLISYFVFNKLRNKTKKSIQFNKNFLHFALTMFICIEKNVTRSNKQTGQVYLKKKNYKYDKLIDVIVTITFDVNSFL